MKKETFKDLMLKEREQIDIPISSKLKSTKIDTESCKNSGIEIESTSSSFKRYALTLFGFCFFVCMSVALLTVLLPYGKEKSSNLTSYIIEMEYTSICVTADSENYVVGVFSLNDDGEKVLMQIDNTDESETLSGFVEKFVCYTTQNNYIEKDKDGEVVVYVVNNKQSTAKQCAKNFTEIFKEQLEQKDCTKVKIIQNVIKLDEFVQKIGLSIESSDLDELENEIAENKRYNYRRYNYNYKE